MSSVIQGIEAKQIINDGIVTRREGVRTEYDSNTGILDIAGFLNGDSYYAELDNEGILTLFDSPSNEISLEEQLRTDFDINSPKRPTQKLTQKPTKRPTKPHSKPRRSKHRHHKGKRRTFRRRY